jgi:hypothetical protein
MPEHSGYVVRVNGRLGSVLINSHMHLAQALDFDNSIQREDREGGNRWVLRHPITFPEHSIWMVDDAGELIYLFDAAQKYRFFRPREFTELFIVNEVEDTNNLTEEENTRYERILDQFILGYRAFSGDVSVRMPADLGDDYPLVRAGIHEYGEEELLIPEPERIATFRPLDIGLAAAPGINVHEHRPPTVDPERVGPILSDFLRSGEPLPEPQALLVKALEELKIGQDFRYALLLGFFSIEQVLTDFLKSIKERAGISEKTIRAYEGEVGMSYKINVELPLVLRPNHPVRDLIPELKGANSIRNNVVHKGHTVNHADAAAVITTADKLMKGLYGRVRPEARAVAPEGAPPANG